LYLKLPSVSTLVRFLKLASVRPGFYHKLFGSIINAVHNLNDFDRHVVLLIDEINLKRNLHYDQRTELIVGFEDFGKNRRTSNPASSALCFMVRSLSGNWRQMIGYVFTSGPIKLDNLNSLVEECLSKLDEIGLKVMCITTDQASNFFLLFKTLGVKTSEPYFAFKQRKIVIPDVPHLLKSTRNAIYSNFIATSEGIVKWKHLEDAYYLNIAKNFCNMPKIKDIHIKLRFWRKNESKISITNSK